MFLYLSPDLCLLGLRSDMNFQLLDLIDRCVPSQTRSNLLNLPQVGSRKLHLKADQQKQDAPELYSELPGKSCEYLCACDFLTFFLNITS